MCCWHGFVHRLFGAWYSTVTANLAWALAADEDINVGVMDVDICGPSIPKVHTPKAVTYHEPTVM